MSFEPAYLKPGIEEIKNRARKALSCFRHADQPQAVWDKTFGEKRAFVGSEDSRGWRVTDHTTAKSTL